MIWAVVALGVVCVALTIALIREANGSRTMLMQAYSQWAEERAALINTAKGAMMPPPRLRQVKTPENGEPKDMKEYGSIGTIEYPPDRPPAA